LERTAGSRTLAAAAQRDVRLPKAVIAREQTGTALMSQWANSGRWARLYSGEDYMICRRGKPNDILTELESSWVTVNEDAPMRGYACLVFRRHAVELHDLQ
jgi:hypothetical protein